MSNSLPRKVDDLPRTPQLWPAKSKNFGLGPLRFAFSLRFTLAGSSTATRKRNASIGDCCLHAAALELPFGPSIPIRKGIKRTAQKAIATTHRLWREPSCLMRSERKKERVPRSRPWDAFAAIDLFEQVSCRATGIHPERLDCLGLVPERPTWVESTHRF